MPITSSSLKFLASQRMTDNDDGGGRITNNEVLDGVENNVFTDIASGDRVTGRVYLRKIFAAVRTNDDDAYLAPRVFIAEPPSDPNVTVALFSTADWDDERIDMQNYVESYVTAGPISEMILYGNHVAGQKIVVAYQRVGAPEPEIGDVYVLSEEPTEDETTSQQFIRVTNVETAAVTWVDTQGNYDKQLVTLTISDALTRAFEGGEQRRVTSYQPPTRIRTTSPVDAAEFKSLSPLTVQAEIGAFSVTAESVYVPIVPATQSETSVLDIQVGGEVAVTVSGGARSAAFPIIAHTDSLPITISNRQLSYTAMLTPKPAPGSVNFSYRALGKWYRVIDDGAGSFVGEAAGTINYSTGSVALTLSAIPDINSSLVWQWGTPVHFETPNLATHEIEFDGWTASLAKTGIEPGTVEVTWVSGGVTKTATADTDGVFSGDGTGRVNHAMGLLFLLPNQLPDPATTPEVTYEYGAVTQEDFTPTKDGNGFVTITTASAITPGTVTAIWRTKRTKTESEKSVST
jgi:hypothetical protein